MTQAVINHFNALAASDRSKISPTAPFYIGDRLLSDTLPESGDPSSAIGDTTPGTAEPESDSGHMPEREDEPDQDHKTEADDSTSDTIQETEVTARAHVPGSVLTHEEHTPTRAHVHAPVLTQ